MKICKLSVAVLLVLATILTTGCDKNTSKGGDTTELNFVVADLPDKVDFDGTTLRFEGAGDTVSITIELGKNGVSIEPNTAGRLYYVLIPTNDSWLTFVRDGSKVHLTAAENRSGMPRVSKVRFAYEETVKQIDVLQNYLRLISFPEGEELVVSAIRADVAFAMITNIAQENLTVSVTEPENAYWINPIAVSNNQVTFTVAHNLSPIDARQATITVSGEGTSASFVVRQKAMSVTDIPVE